MQFTISINGEVELTPEEIWPDGDAPENPTVEDVLEQMQKSGSKENFMSSWNLGDEIDIMVSGNDRQIDW